MRLGRRIENATIGGAKDTVVKDDKVVEWIWGDGSSGSSDGTKVDTRATGCALNLMTCRIASPKATGSFAASTRDDEHIERYMLDHHGLPARHKGRALRINICPSFKQRRKCRFSLTLVHDAHVRDATERKIFVTRRESKVGERRETRLALDLCVHRFECGGMHRAVNHLLALAHNDNGPFVGLAYRNEPEELVGIAFEHSIYVEIHTMFHPYLCTHSWTLQQRGGSTENGFEFWSCGACAHPPTQIAQHSRDQPVSCHTIRQEEGHHPKECPGSKKGIQRLTRSSARGATRTDTLLTL